MITRRNLIKSISIATASTAIAAVSAYSNNIYKENHIVKNTNITNKQDVIFSFGVIADPQYAPIPSNKETRFYSNSLWKLDECIDFFNKENLHFSVTLGDMIDRHYQSYFDILPIYNNLEHKHYFVLGNHDYEIARDYIKSVTKTLGMKNNFYDFSIEGYRFIVLDGNDVSLFAPQKGNEYLGIPDDPRIALASERLKKLKENGAINAQPWNGSLSERQFEWLENKLKETKDSKEKVIILCHYPIYPENKHNMWDSERILSLLTSYNNVVAYFCGHNHEGNYGKLSGIHFVNFKGMVETPTSNAFSTVDITNNKLIINGYGLEENRILDI
ncbi:metallophosphoesterase [Proteus terrae]|uniref:metallophosphoesterase n=1 Tax=Proteus terrae TaxID=1574161 RepID=UPI0034E4CE83